MAAVRAYQVRDRTGIDNKIAIHDKGIGRKTTLYGDHSFRNGLVGCVAVASYRDGSFSDRHDARVKVSLINLGALLSTAHS
jgi:hypothetical protein